MIWLWILNTLSPSTAPRPSSATQCLKEAVQDTDTIIARQVKAFAVTKQLNLQHDSPLTRVVSVKKSPTDSSQSLKTCTKRKQPIYSSTLVRKCQDKCFSMTRVETEHHREFKRQQNVVRKLEKMLLSMNKLYHVDWFKKYTDWLCCIVNHNHDWSSVNICRTMRKLKKKNCIVWQILRQEEGYTNRTLKNFWKLLKKQYKSVA